ncbi:hypothetical protein ACN47E_009414 [Coniothyrium glycines]
MAQWKSDFIKVPTDGPDGFQTMPTQATRRLPEADLKIELCDENDADKIAEGLYTCFPEEWWSKKEPQSLRPPAENTRRERLAKRILPSLTDPHIKWIRAVLASTGEIVGVAGWTCPSNPEIHNPFRKSAMYHYGWKEKMGWRDEEIEEMFAHVDDEAWSKSFAKDDQTRRDVLGDEKHWYLAPLITWPEYQGRGIGKRLLNWAIEQADGPDTFTPMYLESRPSARAVYMHCGFVPQGAYNMVRRGPAVVRGLEAEEEHEAEEGQ